MTHLRSIVVLAILTVFLSCSNAYAAGRVIFQVKVEDTGLIWITIDSTVDDPDGLLVGWKTGCIIGGKDVQGMARPSHYRLPMGQVKRIQVTTAAPGRNELRGSGTLIVEFYVREKLVHTARLPWANGAFTKKQDGYTVRVP